MTAYNRVNGEYCAENKRLLTDILRQEWGYEGAVISDWGAVNERVDGLLAGLDLEMPFNLGEGDAKIVQAVRNGSFLKSNWTERSKYCWSWPLRAMRQDGSKPRLMPPGTMIWPEK